MMPGPTPVDPSYAAMQQVLRSGHGRTVHFHWSGAYDLAGGQLPITPDVSRVYLRALLETDYAALAAKQRLLETAMRGSVVHVTTPLGTDLRFRIGDRPVTRQDGDASAARAKLARNLIDREVELPAGAIRVAPLEESRRRHAGVSADIVEWQAGRWAGSDVRRRPGHGCSCNERPRRRGA